MASPTFSPASDSPSGFASASAATSAPATAPASVSASGSTSESAPGSTPGSAPGSAPGPAGRPPLSVARGVALYIGALLGPGLLLLPGLAAGLAGPASILAWAGLLGVSGLFALVFTALGTRLPDGGGVLAYATAGLGRRVGRAVGWCFLTAVVLGAPVVCLIGAGYVTALTGGGREVTALVAAGLLACVSGLTLAGARIGTAVQMVLVGLLLTVIVAAVAGSLHAARAASWTPFAPHGWTAVGGAASVLMISFVGWEAVAPLTQRLANPARSLPRITAATFAVTTVVYLALACAVIAVLGPRADGPAPVADLLRIAVGRSGPAIAAGAAVLLTLATVNAYFTGAAALAAHLRASRAVRASSVAEELKSGAQSRTLTDARSRARVFFVYIAAAGIVELTAEAFGALDTDRMVTLPTSLFLVVYTGSTAAATRLLHGPLRIAAALACVASVAVFAFSGVAVTVALLVAAAGLLWPTHPAHDGCTG
ncbi:MAG TPA: APC family permease [Actinocrinis sp.]|nr:APC family permease [Actinocrinis sp.]